MVWPGFELRRIFNCGERGEAGEPQGSRLGMAETIGLLGDDRSIDGDLFRVGSFDTLVGHSEHGVPDGEIGDARSDRADDAREVPAKDMREPTEAVSPSSQSHLVIGCVDAGRVNVDHHFAGASRRVGRLAIAQHLRPAVVYQ